MAPSQIRMGKLRKRAENRGIDPDQSYEALKDALDVTECDQCEREFINGWTERFCSDACEAEYIRENFRDENGDPIY